jgi:NAD(P)-dependent dehydrogenase (short-subunit alcohol dehydrogenase family)
MSDAEADVALHDFKNIFSLEGRVAVVTGGSRGLGLHAASGYLYPRAPQFTPPSSLSKPHTPNPTVANSQCRLLQAGCSKVFITSRKASACAAAVAALNALPNLAPGARAYSIPADSSKVSEIERLVKEVEKETDHVDILFANAGATWGEEFLKVDEKNGWDRVMDLNVKGVFFTVQKYVHCLPLSSFFLLNPRCVGNW